MSVKKTVKSAPLEVEEDAIKVKLASFLLRIGIAVALLYAALYSLLDQYAWIGFFPIWLRNIFPDAILIASHAGFEIALALWLLSGRYMRFAGALVAVWMLAIITVNFRVIDITFRDITILFAGLALAVLGSSKK